MYQPIFEITPEIEQHFDSPLRVKAEATVEAIALSKSITHATSEQQVELAKASGWGTLTDIWVKANHQGNTWQHRYHEKLSQLCLKLKSNPPNLQLQLPTKRALK